MYQFCAIMWLEQIDVYNFYEICNKFCFTRPNNLSLLDGLFTKTQELFDTHRRYAEGPNLMCTTLAYE